MDRRLVKQEKMALRPPGREYLYFGAESNDGFQSAMGISMAKSIF
jgi:hypothetical protein